MLIYCVSQQSVTGPYLESEESSPHLHTLFSNVRLNIILLSTSESCKGLLPLAVPAKLLYVFTNCPK